MRFITLVIALVVASAIFSMSATASVYELKPINRNNEQALIAVNKTTLVMLFQPECSWCKKQSKLVNGILSECQGVIHFSMVGTNGSKRKLKQELAYYDSAIPVFYATRAFLRKIGGFQASPTTLVFDEGGKLRAKKRGFINRESLQKAVGILSHGGC
ncbi:MAG: hypothetical protein ACPGUD_09785 [Parashewanella sp.]